RDLLAGGEKHVQLALVRAVGDLVGEADQPVRRLAHGRDDDDDPVAVLDRPHDAPGHALDLRRVGDGGATVLLDDQRHGVGHATPGAGGGSRAGPARRGRTGRQGVSSPDSTRRTTVGPATTGSRSISVSAACMSRSAASWVIMTMGTAAWWPRPFWITEAIEMS